MNPAANGSVISNPMSAGQPQTQERPMSSSQFQYGYQQPPQYNSPAMYPPQRGGFPSGGYQQPVQPQQIPPPQQQGYVDISLIQGLIEQYLQFYYNDEEIIRELERKNISAEMTSYILTKLREQNPNYFKAYEIRLTIKNQISRFNDLVQRHLVSSNPQQMEQQPQQPPQQFQQDMYQQDYTGVNYPSDAFQGDQPMGGL
ncbi:hypothetical protein EIN_226460 [Entamoeba invadens IP1]|uniref:Uncharacterized protein n=1 Tax=Entamoeba invadens IP1 TaxID=370355 RepID=A0A0A1U8G5_ENTIV|nr:hypothetical protein EIN_226460 [Entamoeba invadens IP1]ELP88273.1 hypothetical protein EIN_226460 [Entamoeba invadens IP1]|eukprot:XP_004255044.1 hypothetical protein EIN_226460 [Entamoeba invadens IP1]